MKKYLLGGIAALVLWSLNAATIHADFMFNVSLDTSQLSSDFTAPFGIDFQLVQGDGTVTNTAAISNINLGTGGAAVGSPALTNSSGSLTSGVSLDDSNFFSDFNQQFTPGNTLSFTVDLTTNVGVTAPDEFSFAIFQNYGTPNQGEIPTTDPSGQNTLAAVSITSTSPQVSQYDPAPPTSVPEPSTLVLSVIASASLGLTAGWGRLRRRVAAAA